MALLASLASKISFNLKERTSYVAIQELNETDQKYGDILKFQYFPDTISDNKTVNWNAKEVPGGSLPIYQWINSGERSLSFSAVFTTDTDFSQEGLGGFAESTALYGRIKASAYLNRNVDIKTAILWLRRFLLPRYGEATATGAPLTTAPRKLRLIVPGSGIGWAGGKDSIGAVDRDSLVCVMSQCDVTWTQFFPSGAPRIVEVNLGFLQIPQFNSRISFPFVDTEMDSAVYGNGVSTGFVSSETSSSYFSYSCKASKISG